MQPDVPDGVGRGAEGMNHIEMMRLAEKEALKSVCKRAQVGAVVANRYGDYAAGHNHNNGNECECEKGKTLADVMHAEDAAIMNAWPAFYPVGATLYVTRQPCIKCARLIVEAGIERVFYRDADDKTDGLELLVEHGVKVDSGWIQGQSKPLIEPDLMQKIQDRWLARWPNKKQGEQHGASVQLSREDQSGTGSGSDGVGNQGEKTNA